MPTREGHPDGPLVLEVERFEHVSAGAERVLLRVDGRYGDRPGKRVLDAMLFVDDGLAVHRHAPLSDADGDIDSWLWRAAFDVPVSYLTDERTRFAIESQPGCLIDLPNPSEIRRSSSVPLTARAAHIARRYAVAIAVMVTVAVTPGGMPASARTELLRVHNADGSVVYMTPDGQTVAQIPADAVIVDQQPAPAPAPAPQPAAPQPDPQPQTQTDAIKPAKDETGGISGLAAGARKQAAGPKKQKVRKPREVKPTVTQTESQPQTPTASTPQHAPAAPKHHP